MPNGLIFIHSTLISWVKLYLVKNTPSILFIFLNIFLCQHFLGPFLNTLFHIEMQILLNGLLRNNLNLEFTRSNEKPQLILKALNLKSFFSCFLTAPVIKGKKWFSIRNWSCIVSNGESMFQHSQESTTSEKASMYLLKWEYFGGKYFWL